MRGSCADECLVFTQFQRSSVVKTMSMAFVIILKYAVLCCSIYNDIPDSKPINNRSICDIDTYHFDL